MVPPSTIKARKTYFDSPQSVSVPQPSEALLVHFEARCRLDALIQRHCIPVAIDFYQECGTPAVRSCSGHRFHQATAGGVVGRGG